MKKILMLTDFSEASRNALQFARAFFSDTVADFHLLYVYPVKNNSFHPHRAEPDHSAYTDQLNDIVTELRLQATPDWHTFRSSAQSGHLLDLVEQAANTEVYDFVVIGPQKNDINELFGNSAIALVHRLKANVFVVPTDAQARPIYQVVLAVDFANLKNVKLLNPLKEFVTLKGALLTLLTIDTPEKDIIHVEQEIHIRQFLSPIKPVIARLQAASPKEGIDTYLAEHTVDLLVTIPRYKGMANALPGSSSAHSQAYTPSVPLLTLYDDDSNDLPQLIDDLSNADCAL